MGIYNCQYRHQSGAICNEGCYRPEGCTFHWNAPKQESCRECGESTKLKYSACKKHSEKYQNREYYNRKKQAKLDE